MGSLLAIFQPDNLLARVADAAASRVSTFLEKTYDAVRVSALNREVGQSLAQPA